MFEQSFDLEDGTKITVRIKKTKCGKGLVICQDRLAPDGTTRVVECSGSCGGGPTIHWTCPAGTDCFLDCTTGTPFGGCH